MDRRGKKEDARVSIGGAIPIGRHAHKQDIVPSRHRQGQTDMRRSATIKTAAQGHTRSTIDPTARIFPTRMTQQHQAPAHRRLWHRAGFHVRSAAAFVGVLRYPDAVARHAIGHRRHDRMTSTCRSVPRVIQRRASCAGLLDSRRAIESRAVTIIARHLRYFCDFRVY